MSRSLVLMTLVCVSLVALAGCGGSSNPDPPAQQNVVSSLREGNGGGSESSGAAAASTGTGWGTLKGQFVYAGDAPDPAALAVTKDVEVCGKHPVLDESLVVDPNSKGLANVVIYARKVSRVFESDAPAEQAVFDQKDCVFLSHVLAVRTDEPMLIKNSDPLGHNTNVTPQGDRPFNLLISADGDATYQFSRAQSKPVPVACNVHPWMKAYIIPRKDQYVAVTDAEGRFEIAQLPAGEELEFQVWHEKANSGLEAKSGWSRGRFKLTIPADGVEDLGTIEVAASALE